MSPTNPIDDIFSSSKKPTRHVVPKTTEPAASSKQAQESSKKKRKRKAEPEAAGNDSDDAPPAKTAKRQPDVVVVDATAVSAVKLANKMSSKPPKATKTAPKQDADSDEEKFKDSRGTGPRRRTEEGFLIFKEDELGIDPEAGGTPDCPFDCSCCF